MNSPNFHSHDGNFEVDDCVSIFASTKVAKAQMAAMSNARTPMCMATLMNGPHKGQIESSGGKGTTVGTISVTRATSPRGTAAFTVGLPITSQGVSLTVNLTIVSFIKRQLGQQITFYSYGPTFPATLETHLTSVGISRL